MQVELHRQTRHEIADFKSLAYEIEIRNYSAYLLRFICILKYLKQYTKKKISLD